MIDLHMHTKYSDGSDSVGEILKNATKAYLKAISITDHDACDAYVEMEGYDVSEYFKGNIVVGCEFTTSFEKRLIEILGYGFDYKKVNEYLKNFYTPENTNEATRTLYFRLMKRIRDLGLVCTLEVDPNRQFTNRFFEREIYDELVSHPENFEIVKEDIWASFSDFFRKGLTRTTSQMFINPTEARLPLKDILDIIHSSGGIAFLAHTYQYKFDDTEEFLGRLYDEYDIDGIECFYTSFSKEQTESLLDFARRRNLLVSGGSDYHGSRRSNHNLGVGDGSLRVNDDIVSNWGIEYFQYLS